MNDQNIFNSYKVVQQTQFGDGQTDGWIDRCVGGNNMSPDPEDGDI